MRARLRELSTSVAIYGAGDVAIQIVSFGLLPLYIRYLTQSDYGALAWLVGLEAVFKIVSRWGLDGAFMRFYLDAVDVAARRRLASTLLIFQAAATGALLIAALAVSGPLAAIIFGDLAPEYLTALRLLFVNTFLVSFTYVPFHLMRMEKRALAFSALTFARSASTLVLRLWLVVGVGYGVLGLMLADFIVTLALAPVLWGIARPIVGLEFSAGELRRALRFGLPRLPHGLAQQALDAGNTMLLSAFLTLDALGVYHIGTTIGRGLKLFLSAFETGWAPFYYHTAREADARTTFSKITTYGVAVLALLVSTVVAASPDLVRVLTTSAYAEAARVIPLIALGVGFQGVYLLTSIGLNLSGRTEFYPLSTFAAAAVGLGSGLVLMPAFGPAGAAASFALSYVTLAGVAFLWSQRVYPVSYEGPRLARVVVAGVAAALVLWLPAPTGYAWADLGLNGGLAAAVFLGVLAATGFFRDTERKVARELVSRWSRRPGTGR